MTSDPVETLEFAAMLRRMIRSYGRRLADADPVDIATALGILTDLDAAIARAVQAQRSTYGRSWAEIAQALGVTRQAAYKRWAHR